MDLIAEIGWNHMGDMNLAETMIKAAKNAGATHAKFQTWSEKDLKAGPWDTDGRRDIYKKAELSEKQFQHLLDICLSENIKFLTSVFNAKDVVAMSEISSSAIKIPSPEIANEELLKKAAKSFRKVYLSTGASTEEEIDKAVEILEKNGTDFTLLHCVSKYPCEDHQVNLPRIQHLKKKNKSVGISDHSPDSLSAILAIPLGISVIEKHFTTDNELPGRDNKFALLPKEFAKITTAIKRYEMMIEDLGIEFQNDEQEVREIYRGRWNETN